MFFYSVLFLILNCSVCIYSIEPWENLVDRLDLLIKRSYLIIRCNQHEVQIVSLFTTYEELQSNCECTNKDRLFEHGIDKVQIIDFNKIVQTCHNDKIVRFESRFSQIKPSLNREGNGVNWPFIHTPYTKDIGKSNPEEMNFLEKKEINFILTELNSEDLPEEKQTYFINVDFVNRPMVCRIRVDGLQKKTNDGTCGAKVFDKCYEPVCYYKVGGKKSPSHDEINPIHRSTFSYVKSRQTPYTYISDISTYISDIDTIDQLDGQSQETAENKDSTEKPQNSNKTISESKEKKKSRSPLILIILILLICFIVIITVGMIIFYRKYWMKKENEEQSTKQQSNPSLESEVTASTSSSSIISENVPSTENSIEQIQTNQQKPKRQPMRQIFKLDDEI